MDEFEFSDADSPDELDFDDADSARGGPRDRSSAPPSASAAPPRAPGAGRTRSLRTGGAARSGADAPRTRPGRVDGGSSEGRPPGRSAGEADFDGKRGAPETPPSADAETPAERGGVIFGGRRRKKRKIATSREGWDEDFSEINYGTPASASCSEKSGTPSAYESAGRSVASRKSPSSACFASVRSTRHRPAESSGSRNFSTPEESKGTPSPTRCDASRNPQSRQSSRSSGRSVRFSLDSNTKYYYGTPPTPGVEIRGNTPADSWNGANDRSDHDPFGSGEETSLPDSSNRSAGGSDGSAEESAQSRATDPAADSNPDPPGPISQKPCLKPSERRSRETASSASSPDRSDRSTPSRGSARPKKRSRSRFDGRRAPGDSSRSPDPNSPEETPMVALGRVRDVGDVQDAGSYRMMIDELSYLCSALLGCRRRDRPERRPRERPSADGTGIKHTPATAGAACDLAEMMSQSGMRAALLSAKSNLGAISAVLEGVGCAPLATDWMGVCGGFAEDAAKRPRPKAKEGGRRYSGRTKSARRKQNGSDEMDSSGAKSMLVRDKYDAISSKALAIVAYFVSVLCMDKSVVTNSGISKVAIKSARNAVLGHKSALKGIARLVADDPVVDAYLRREAVSNGVVESPSNHDDLFNVTSAEEGFAEDESVASCGTSISKSSNFSALSDKKVDEDDKGANTSDPTKFGRRKGRKNKSSRLKQALATSETGRSLEPILEVDDGTDHSLGSFKWTSEEVNDPVQDLENDSKSAENVALEHSGEKSPEHQERNDEKFESLDFASDDGSRASKSRAAGVPSEKVELKSGLKYQEKIALALSRTSLGPTIGQAILASDVVASENVADCGCSYCATWEQHMLVGSDSKSTSPMSAANLALHAADCIISGRNKSSPSNDDDERDEEDCSDEDTDDFLHSNDSDEDITSKNPILFANEMMRKSGSLPDYSRAMASTLVALLLSFRPQKAESEPPDNACNKCKEAEGKPPDSACNKCITYLLHRASMFSGIIDSLCCLSPETSKVLSCPESLLIPQLIRVISAFYHHTDRHLSFIEESVMTALKTLTTLTHENLTACNQVIVYCQNTISTDNSILHSTTTTANGVDIIFSHLFKTVTEASNHKSSYDAIIFCLNILTNIAEMIPGSTRDISLDLRISGDTTGITWLTQWLVSKTAGFQNAVMKGSFGSNPNNESLTENEDELQSGEEVNLVAAGNGFVLLAYLMLDDNNGTAASRLRDIIIHELPIDETGNSGGIQYMIKTLKAFCNFYHYSVGDLSVAVIAPVIKLIAGLERIDLMEKSKKWL